MADLPNNVRFTWQLVSQFVSWEFCRYMSENSENNSSETDVLAFLRNMIVQRTEKSASDVTKHEILAKFIMEIKAINNFQVSSIIPLSESVKRICPELSSPVSKVVHHLETFYKVLETTDESRKDLLLARIEETISDFSKEASRVLPEPDLLQVVDSWNEIHHHHDHPHPEPLKKSVYNSELFEKVLECLHYEGTTASEAKLIAVSLNEDKVFENILRKVEAEPETEADSEAFTFSQSSQPVYSQEFIKNTQLPKTGVNPLNHDSPHFQAHSQVRPHVNNSPLQLSDGSPEQPGGLNLVQNEDPPAFLAGTPPSPPPSPDYPFIHGNFSIQDRDPPLQKSSFSHRQFAQSSANESEESDAGLQDRIQAKFQQIHETQQKQNQSDTDTSDCDISPDIKFLTPTYFKKGNKQIIYVSDVESNNSSVITNMPNSQQTDPSWSRRKSFLPATEYARPNKKKKMKNSPVKKKPLQRNSPAKKKRPIQRIYSSDSDESPVHTVSGKLICHPSTSDTPIDICELSPQFRSPHQPSTSATKTKAELRGPPKKRQMKTALYRSPTLCIDEFVSVLRKPNSDTLSSEISVPDVKKAKKTVAPSGFNTVKRQKCKQCKKTYKTAIALRRHVFLKHTEPPEDSDCDT